MHVIIKQCIFVIESKKHKQMSQIGETINFSSSTILSSLTGIEPNYSESNSTLELYEYNDKFNLEKWEGVIEWNDGKEIEHIDVKIEGGYLTDYDTVYEIPYQAFELLRSVGVNTELFD